MAPFAQGKSLTEAAMSWRSCHLAQHRWFGSDHNKFWCLPSWTQDRARKALSRGKYVWSFVGATLSQADDVAGALDEKRAAAHFNLLLLSSLDPAVKSYENTEVLR